jgi:hypothetical protein
MPSVNGPAIELLKGELFLLGDAERIDDRLSWYPAEYYGQYSSITPICCEAAENVSSWSQGWCRIIRQCADSYADCLRRVIV